MMMMMLLYYFCYHYNLFHHHYHYQHHHCHHLHYNDSNNYNHIYIYSYVGYSVTLLHSRGLLKSEHNSGNMYAKIRFVDHDGKVSNVNQQEKRTPSIIPCSNPDWKEFDALFKVSDGFEEVNFIRIDICIDDYTSKSCIGNCFLPLRYFNKKAKEYTFAITPKNETTGSSFPLSSSLLSTTSSSSSSSSLISNNNNASSTTTNPFGEMTVRIQRYENDADKTSTMMIKPTLMESNIFNTRWYTESYAGSSSMNIDGDNSRDIETFSLMPAIDYIELVTTSRNTFHITKHDSKLPATRPSSLLSTHRDNNIRASRRIVLTEVEIYVFENQRRQFFFPFDWAKKAYTRPDFSDLSYTIDYYFQNNSIEFAKPPEGFSWVHDSKWEIDKSYRKTDNNGWCYGLNFSKILSDYHLGKSNIKPLGTQVRRRKWIRKAVINITYGESYGPITLQALNNFAFSNKKIEKNIMNSKKKSPTSLDIDGSNDGGRNSSSSSSLDHFDHPNNSWRIEILQNFPNSVISTCKERILSNGIINIPYEQILDVTIVTPSLLTITIKVHRFFSDHHKNKCFYRPVEIDLFVSNCPAAELKSLIDERKWFYRFKMNIHEIVNSEKIHRHRDTLINHQSSHNDDNDDSDDDDDNNKHLHRDAMIHPPHNDDDEDDEDDHEAEIDDMDIDVDDDNTTKGPPETEELSLGSVLVGELDEYSIALEAQVIKLNEILKRSDNPKVKMEKSIIIRRDCRLRLYMAALFSIGK